MSYHDPYVPEWQVDRQLAAHAADLDQALSDADLTILPQPAAAYDAACIARAARLLLDTCVVPAAPSIEAL